MKKMYFTIAGCAYRYGLAVFKPGMTVTLVKEPENQYDSEAIRVMLDGLGTVGYVANSPKTVRGTSMSAGRLYDKIPRTTTATVVYVLSDSVICSVENQQAVQSDPEPFQEDSSITYRSSDTADLDLYSQEDSSYLLPTEQDENPSQSDSEDDEVPPPDYINSTKTDSAEPEYNTDERIEENVRPETENSENTFDTASTEEHFSSYDASYEEDGSDAAKEADDTTVSPEDIASALKAALAGLTIGQGNAADENPDAEYIYSYQTDNTPKSPPAEESGTDDFTEKAKEFLSGVSGLSAADFVSTLTGKTGLSVQSENPASFDTDFPVTDTASEDIPQYPSETADDSWKEDTISRAPGLNINTARFPEEEEGNYDAPVRKETVRETAVPEPEQSEAGRENLISESALYSEAAGQETEIAIPESPQEEDASSLQPLETDTESSTVSEEETVSTVQGQEETEDIEDDLTKPLVYDESDLDENLAQLHLGDIDATYLSDSFLEKLKNKLKESTS